MRAMPLGACRAETSFSITSAIGSCSLAVAATPSTGGRSPTRRSHFAGPAPIYSTNRLTYSAQRSIFNRMVELDAPQLDSVFHALGDPTRRAMLRELARGEQSVGQLAEPFAISLAAASKHIKALENARLIPPRGARPHACSAASTPDRSPAPTDG